ncbi:hypothetical protein [Desulfobulbus sp.]|uniref:hypothetical protein n=1 Tax=Desulfobulbus sp. TaxID=895 RepID=UPI0027BAA483|nr:hypothetical protein [Desulfobulbus sp.]
MTANDYLTLFGLLVVFLGFGLLLYVSFLGLLLRFHIRLFPLIAKRYDRMLKESEKNAQLENQEPSAK